MHGRTVELWIRLVQLQARAQRPTHGSRLLYVTIRVTIHIILRF